jgi:S1-C subfamily serine protease
MSNNGRFNRREFLRHFGLVSAGTLGGFILGRSSHGSSLRAEKLDGSAIFRKCVDSVVVIHIHSNNSFGAGFCLDRFSFAGKNTSFVVTADHVTDGGQLDRYRLNSDAAKVVSHAAKVSPIGEAYSRDGPADMAAFSCDLDLTPLPIAGKPPAVGESIFTLGHPLGNEFTLSSGIISGYRFDGSPRMQITAPISPGSSGGPVLNQWGEVVGLVSSYKHGAQNLNLVVPASELLALKFRLHALARTISDEKAHRSEPQR